MIELFLKLMIGHFVADFPLQGEFLSKAKNHRQPIPGVPSVYALAAHAAIQAGAVWLITGRASLALIEFFAHAVIDFGKCEGAFSFAADQVFHVICKLFYVAAIPATSL